MTPLLLLCVAQATTSTAAPLSLPQYVRAYRSASHQLPIRRLDAQIAKTEVVRRTERTTRELSVSPDLGARLYHYTGSGSSKVVGELNANARYAVAGNDGAAYAVSAQSGFPTSAGHLGRTIRYGVDGEYSLPLLRNRGGREFEHEAKSLAERQTRAEAAYDVESLLACRDAGERYVMRYAAERQLEAFRALLAEKKRVWFRTVADFKNKLIKRLDLLAAKSDWLLSQSLEPGFVARMATADAALRAYAPLPTVVTMADPPRLSIGSDATDHPRLRALQAELRAFEQEILFTSEQGKDDLDLRFSVGVDRFHDLADPAGRPGDTTDVQGLVGVRYLWPIARPDITYRTQILRYRAEQTERRSQDILRRLNEGIAQNRAILAGEEAAYGLLEEQIDVLRSQIRAAYEDFRAGQLEFQNYLDHWDRYQRARLDIWDRWLGVRLAEFALVELTGKLPEACLAQAD